ncbi:MAG TPA: nitroreductase/quinone reductase family protein [Acidimicrobiales bacterium]
MNQAQRLLEKYVSNPVMRQALRWGIAPRSFALVETTGRRTGRRRLTPVGNGLDGTVFWLVSEHGELAAYVKNLRADPLVRVKVGRSWHSGTATLMPDDDGWARRKGIDDANGVSGKLDGIIFRAFANNPLTIRVDLDPTAG